VPVLADDTPETLGARVLAAEHILYPKVLALVAAERVRIVNELCVFSDRPPESDGPGVLVSPPGI
jgi:phosphoribosylglycinamide formyltransferase-1